MMISDQLEIFIRRLPKWAGRLREFVAALFPGGFDQKEMISEQLEIFTHRFSKWAGSASGFVAALLSILVLLLAGVVYGFSQGCESGL